MATSRAREIAKEVVNAATPYATASGNPQYINADVACEQAIQQFAREMAEKIRATMELCAEDAEGLSARIAFDSAAQFIEDAAGVEHDGK